MGALPKRKISTRRKGKRRVDHQRKFDRKLNSDLSRAQRLDSKPTN